MPKYPLADILAQMVSVGTMYRSTNADDHRRELGMTRADALAVIRGITPKDFHKSMPTYADSEIWQDVYRPHWNGIQLYVKFTKYEHSGEYFVISFKEK